MSDQNQPTPEQRAAWRNALTVLPDDGLGVVANEAIPALDAEVDRLTFELSAAREDHNATKTGWERAAAELHHADERVRDAERLGRALRGELDECTRERDEARAELAALRATVQVGEGEVLVRAKITSDPKTEYIGLEMPETDTTLFVPRSAIPQFLPPVAPHSAQEQAKPREGGGSR